MWESSEPYGRVEPFSEIRREAEYTTTLIPVLRHDRSQTRLGPGEGIVPPSHAVTLVAIEMQPSSLARHIGSATIETRTAMGMLALDNVEAVLNGGPAPALFPGRNREIV